MTNETRRPLQRRYILDVCAELFARHGYRGTSLSMAAERLGVTRQALYYHYPNKTALLAALFDERMAALTLSATSSKPTGGEPRLVAVVRGHLEITFESPARTSVLIHERAETDRIASLHAKERRHAYTTHVATVYAEGVSQGALRPIDASDAATLIVAAADSVVWWCRPRSGLPSEDSVVDDSLYLLLSGYGSG